MTDHEPDETQQGGVASETSLKQRRERSDRSGSDAGVVRFVGAGPGAADLLTIRAANAIAAADVVVWAASLVMAEAVTDHARADAELLDSSSLTLEDVDAVYARAARQRLAVARVHSGDPALWSAIGEQIDRAEAHGLAWEIVPGVGSLSAAAASLGEELTVPETAQSLIATRLATATPMPPGEDVAAFAAHGTTMALFLSAKRGQRLQAELEAGGYSPETPCAVCYRVSWPDEQVWRCRLDELAATLRAAGVVRHTLVLVGPGLTRGPARAHDGAAAGADSSATEGGDGAADPDAPAPPARSRLYDPGFAHLHRLPGGRPGPAPAGEQAASGSDEDAKEGRR